ncbi:MAG: hypothetical protein AAB470_00155 [Patescibacteria group bacterium]
MRKTITRTYNIAHEYQRQITLTVIAFCVVLALGYAVNLYYVISKTVALQRINAETTTLSAEIQGLDAKYLSISGTITPDIFRKYDLNKGQVSAFISRTTLLGRADLTGHEL